MNFVSFVKNAVEQLNENNDSEIRVRSYSGRGMFGATCLGITTDQYTSPSGVIKDLIVAFVEQNHENKNFIQEFRQFTDYLNDPRSDSMGRGTVTYFPDIDWVDEDEDEDE